MFKKDYLLMLGLILVSILFCYCNRDSVEKDAVILSIGGYDVSQKQFYEELNRILRTQSNLNKKEVGGILLNNYISAGLLIEGAKEMNYKQKTEFIKRITYYKEQSTIQHIKLNRSKEKELSYQIKNDLLKYFADNIKIDYVRIPKQHKKLSALMFKNMKAGVIIKSLLENPEIDSWNSLGVSFYDNIPIESALLTKKVLGRIIQMREDEVEMIKTKSAYHVVRFRQCLAKPYSGIDEKQAYLNLRMAYALDYGDTIMDKYSLKKAIICNDELLSKIDFSIPSVLENNNSDINSLALLCGFAINKNDVIEKIYELPQNVQSLFKNKSTRIKALSTLILLNYYDEGLDVDMREYQSFIIDELKKSMPIDTVAFFENWINKELTKHNTSSLSEILKYKTKNNQFINEVKEAQSYIVTSEGRILTKQKKYYSWLSPKLLPGFDSLKLNYKTIEEMKIPHKEIKQPNEILAYAGKWELTIGEFIQALDKLTPETRVDIAKEDNAIRMIKYMASEETGIEQDVKINSSLLKSMDIIGNSLDYMGYVVNENSVVGSLGKISLTVSDLRILANQLPESEKNRLINKPSRKDAFDKIIMDKFWLGQSLSNEEIKKDVVYTNNIKKHENWLLAELFYESAIRVVPIELNDEKLNMQFQKAVKTINNKRLENYLQKASKGINIKVNKEVLSDLEITPNSLMYANVIQETN